MTPAPRPKPDRDGMVRLAASVVTDVPADRIAQAIERGALHWPRVLDAEPVGLRRYAVDLRVRLGGGSSGMTTFGKAAYLDLGTPRKTPDGWEVEISWRASTAAPLFPVFSGTLTIASGELRVEGLYAPPGGAIGRAADRMVLHVVANGTARWLLNELAREAAEA